MSEEKSVSKKTADGETTAVKETKKKKYVIAGTDAFGMYYLGFEGGGELPDKLKGSKYTSERSALEAIEALNEGR